MSFRISFAVVFCLSALFVSVQVFAQNQLSDAKTEKEVQAYIDSENRKLPPNFSDSKKRVVERADILTAASDRMMEIAQNADEKASAYRMKLQALVLLTEADIEGAEQKLIPLLDEYYAWANAENNGSTYDYYHAGRFLLYCKEMMKPGASFDVFMSDVKARIKSREMIMYETYMPYGMQVAEWHKVPAGQFIEGMIEAIRLIEDPYFSDEEKEFPISLLESFLRFAPGTDPQLYGKTLDDKDFDWQSLRGKYVLIQFTATWCGPCKEEFPGMLHAYEKYHDKGLEIISVYIAERQPDPVEKVKKQVEQEKLPWIILSEELTEKAGLPAQRKFYTFYGLPSMCLVDKEGKVIMMRARGDKLQVKLRDIFEHH